MKLTARSEYALLALIYIARSDGEHNISADSISKAQGIPPKFLEQILLSLRRARILNSSQGQHGGYKLARPAKEVSIAEVVRIFDGALAPTESVSRNFYEKTPIEKETGLVRVFKDIRDYTSNLLENTSVADLI
ncbi:MAG: Rrf2 family transcriptional regulator [Anaerolineales bacterium]|nr:Rrf2 family transcriptional regulator [Anaerolineales bacterium]QYK50456.1 MAG: Rrf2 family transcriptional regulator [Anaerolineales bacterium]